MKLNMTLLDYQERAFFSEKQFITMISGTGAGKTFLLPFWLTVKAYSSKSRPLLGMGPTLKHVKRNLWGEYMLKFLRKQPPYCDVPGHADVVDHDLIEGEHFVINKSDFTVFFPQTGSTIYFVGANEPGSWQGIHAEAIATDETDLYSQEAIDTLRQRTAFSKTRQCLNATTPYGWGPLKVDTYDEYEAHRLAGTLHLCDHEIIQVRSIDNPWYDVDNYKREERKLPRWKFDMLYNGIYTKPKGLVYEEVTIIDDFKIPKHWPCYGSVDFGFNDPATVNWIARDPNSGVEYIIKEWKHSGQTLDQIEEEIRKGPGKRLYGDAAAKGDIETLKAHGIDIVSAPKPPGSVEAGIRLVDSAFRTQKLLIFRSCVETIKETKLYSYKLDRTGEPLDQVQKRDDLYSRVEPDLKPSVSRAGRRQINDLMKGFR